MREERGVREGDGKMASDVGSRKMQSKGSTLASGIQRGGRCRGCWIPNSGDFFQIIPIHNFTEPLGDALSWYPPQCKI